MSGHTPGPWVVTRDRWNELSIESANERDLADLPVRYVLANDIGGKIHGDSYDDFSEVEANARLIAAAPELLEAADNALGVLIACCVSAGGVDDQVAIIDAQRQLRAAIAKATGAQA